MRNGNSKFNKIKYSLLSKLGSMFNLSFLSHVLLYEKIFGVDGIKRKVLVAEENNGSNSSCIIELDKIKSISMKTVNNSIKPEELRKR
jgi:glutamine phosphoribosylpyrophosphate amidotransferase